MWLNKSISEGWSISDIMLLAIACWEEVCEVSRADHHHCAPQLLCLFEKVKTISSFHAAIERVWYMLFQHICSHTFSVFNSFLYLSWLSALGIWKRCTIFWKLQISTVIGKTLEMENTAGADDSQFKVIQCAGKVHAGFSCKTQ